MGKLQIKRGFKMIPKIIYLDENIRENLFKQYPNNKEFNVYLKVDSDYAENLINDLKGGL